MSKLKKIHPVYMWNKTWKWWNDPFLPNNVSTLKASSESVMCLLYRKTKILYMNLSTAGASTVW